MTRPLVRPAFLIAAASALLLAGCEPPPVTTVQHGYRGTGMVEVYHPATVEAAAGLNAPPSVTPAASADGPKAGTLYQNVKVLGDLSVAQFAGLMVDMTNWVAPQQGCTYCHVGANFADESLYTKQVARKMLQMTQHINADWKGHVANTGVTCYTCHRGNNVPTNIWYAGKTADSTPGMLGNKAGQNAPNENVGLASLPNDPFTGYIQNGEQIRVVATSALPQNGIGASIQQTETSYGLMMHMSKALGVNCTYCHNSRSFASWESSSPQRTTAYYGIRMARDLNNNYLSTLAGVFPAERLGPTGDVPKLNCATCHQGAYKPLYGADILHGYPGLTGGVKGPVTAAPGPAPVVGVGPAEVYFAVGSSALPSEAGATLADVARAAMANTGTTISLSGYHSAAGTLAQNQELAKQRAFAVRDALVAAGVPADRIALDKPQQTEANIAGEDPKARRVEVSMK